jgi:hypothetical protein
MNFIYAKLFICHVFTIAPTKAKEPRTVKWAALLVQKWGSRLLDLGFFVHHVLACLGIELHDLHFCRHRALVLVGGVEVTRTCGRFQLDFVASMPTLSITRIPAQDKRRETQRFSDSTKIRRFCKLGRKRRFVLLLAWETLLPTIGPLPVTSQTRAIAHSLINFRMREKREYSVKTVG